MLVSSIIANALSKADVSNQSFYTQNDQVFDAQAAWNTIYELLTENDDDYFVTSKYLVPSSAFTLDANRQSLFLYPLPDDFFRLRMLSYQSLSGGFFLPCTKMDTSNFGMSQSTPGYRLVGKNLEIYDPYGFTLYNFWYYPQSQVLTLATDIAYPNNVLTEYMVWQIAADIRRKQNRDPAIQVSRAGELYQKMKQQISRDDFRVQVPKDIFSDGNNYWF